MTECDPDTKSGPTPPPNPRPRLQAEIDVDRSARLAKLDPTVLDVPPPTPEAWREFVRNLAYAQAVAREPDPASRSEISATRVACAAVIELLRSVGADDLESPWWTLIKALKDVAAGAPLPDLLDPKKAMTSKPALSSDDLMLRASVCVAVQELHDAGFPLDRAYRQVAKHIEGRGVKPRGSASLAATIEGWRERSSASGELARDLSLWREQYRKHAGRDGTARERAKFLLEELRAGNL